MNPWTLKWSAFICRVAGLVMLALAGAKEIAGESPINSTLAAAAFALLSIAFDLARIAERKP